MHPNNLTITTELIADHGLTGDDYDKILQLLGRAPTFTELGIFSAMWNEHCSYKSSKKWLRTLPTTGARVVQGPGENAGVVDIGEGLAVVFKMESHNHPSFIEPYQGAATGVGGILRDVFTMGARPVAAMNALRFGAPEHLKTRHLLDGVVAGIGGYGNAFGVPTVGGEVGFDGAYNGNILVNAFAAGIAPADRIFYAKASGVGLPVVYLGAKTGRDGIHGSTMASAEFADDAQEKRPTVQVGDPFREKCLMEACLELMQTDAVIAIQDMGAAGLTCSAVEMGAKGDLGIVLDLDKVPCREDHMSAYEMMLSESQERMLMVLDPSQHAVAEAIFRKWDLDFAIVGETTDDLRFRVHHKGEEVADLPIKALGDEAPEYDRPYRLADKRADVAWADVDAVWSGHKGPDRLDMEDMLLRLIGSPDLCSRQFVWEQYDYFILSNTILPPGADAGVVRIEDSNRALAFSVDVTPRYCQATPFEGGKQAVAEVWRNLVSVGATPLAITDCLNFGNPEREDIMGQFVACINGISAACKALEMPVVSGNVSLYNETEGVAIPPTPAIAGVGLIDDLAEVTTLGFKNEGDRLYMIGDNGGLLNRSLYLREVAGGALFESSAAPPVDLQKERRHGALVRALIGAGRINACHDVSDGGLAVALAEMALARGFGARVALDADESRLAGALFGEEQGRFVVASPLELDDMVADLDALARGVAIVSLGRVAGDSLAVEGVLDVPLAQLRQAHEGWFSDYMSGAGSQALHP